MVIVLGQSIFNVCDRICLIILTLALAFICPISCQHIYFDSHCLPCLLHGSYFSTVSFSVVNDIWRVMIPFVCILYSNANLKIMHEFRGSFPLLFRTLSYQSIFDPFNWHLISILCVYERQTFFLLMLCAIMKSVESVWFIWCYLALSMALLSHSSDRKSVV